MIEKRQSERRLFTVNLRPALRVEDKIDTVDSIVPLSDTNSTLPTISNISKTDDSTTFLVAGGQSGKKYTIRIRFSVASTPEQDLEAVVILNVI